MIYALSLDRSSLHRIEQDWIRIRSKLTRTKWTFISLLSLSLHLEPILSAHTNSHLWSKSALILPLLFYPSILTSTRLFIHLSLPLSFVQFVHPTVHAVKLRDNDLLANQSREEFAALINSLTKAKYDSCLLYQSFHCLTLFTNLLSALLC